MPASWRLSPAPSAETGPGENEGENEDCEASHGGVSHSHEKLGSSSHRSPKRLGTGGRCVGCHGPAGERLAVFQKRVLEHFGKDPRHPARFPFRHGTDDRHIVLTQIDQRQLKARLNALESDLRPERPLCCPRKPAELDPVQPLHFDGSRPAETQEGNVRSDFARTHDPTPAAQSRGNPRHDQGETPQADGNQAANNKPIKLSDELHGQAV